MKRQFIILVMAGMLLVPYGTVFASSGGVGAVPVGYVFPTTQSMVVLGSDALTGTVLSSDELVGYSYVPWVVVNSSDLNLPVGYNLLDFFDYGCEGFSKEDLVVKIMIAPTYQEEGSTEFITGIFMDVTSDPVISEEGAYAYKIIVTKPGSDSPLSAVETGYIGVSSLVSSAGEVAVASSSSSEERGTASVSVGFESPVVEAVAVVSPVEGGVIESPVGGVVAPALSSPVDVFEGVGGSGIGSLSVASSASVVGGSFTPDPEWADYYDVWSVRGEVRADYILRCLELINIERAKIGADPFKLDQDLTVNALKRAAECNIYYSHTRAGWHYGEKYASGGEILVMGGLTPELTVGAWMKSGNHSRMVLNRTTEFVGIGHVNGSWVMFSRGGDDDWYKDYFKPADLNFIKTLENKNRVDNVVVAKSIMTPQFRAGYINSNIDMGQTTQCAPKILTKGTWTVTSYVDVVASTVKWTSSNPRVASVDSNGLVTGLTTGQAVITGTLHGQSITFTINVSDRGNPVYPPLGEHLVKYRTHVQNVGWQGYVADGFMSGTSGRSLRLEGINVALDPSVGGGIEYRTHVQNIGWQNYVSNGAMSGTEGLGYRLEGINIRLTGAAAEKYDIYYRVHTQNIGWMGWAKNGEASGSAGFGYRLEGIEIQLVAKGAPAPGSTAKAFVENK